MNFLAHLYLSGTNKELILGNFIADMVKGKQIEKYSYGVQSGIKLHREIDKFTDNHKIVKLSKNRLRKKYRHYAPVIVDMYYDHFLAKNWDEYSDVCLKKFLNESYNILIVNYAKLPTRGQRILPFMIANNWLKNYANFDSLNKNFKGMANRTNFDSGMETAVDELKRNYSLYQNEFKDFFPHLIEFSENTLSKLLKP